MLLCAQAEKMLTDDWVYPLNFGFFPRVFHFSPMSFTFLHQYSSSIFKIYRAVLSKCEIFIKMRVAESRPSFDIEKSLFHKNTLFFEKNHFFNSFNLLFESRNENWKKWNKGFWWGLGSGFTSSNCHGEKAKPEKPPWSFSEGKLVVPSSSIFILIFKAFYLIEWLKESDIKLKPILISCLCLLCRPQ